MLRYQGRRLEKPSRSGVLKQVAPDAVQQWRRTLSGGLKNLAPDTVQKPPKSGAGHGSGAGPGASKKWRRTRSKSGAEHGPVASKSGAGHGLCPAPATYSTNAFGLVSCQGRLALLRKCLGVPIPVRENLPYSGNGKLAPFRNALKLQYT